MFKIASNIFNFFLGTEPSKRFGTCEACLQKCDDLHFSFGYAFANDFCQGCCPGKRGEACDHGCDIGVAKSPGFVLKLRDVVCPDCGARFFLNPARDYELDFNKPEPRCFSCWKENFDKQANLAVMPEHDDNKDLELKA